jgi:predicted N-acetyltransferase YhbS
VEVVEFGSLSSEQRAELEGEETDPFDMRRVATELRWRAKDRHVALRACDGPLLASVGLLLTKVQVGDGPPLPAVGIGGVIVVARCRGRGLGDRVIAEALDRAATLGPGLAILFCHRDRAGLYARHGFAEIGPPVLVEQPGGLVELPQVSMWRAIREDMALPAGRTVVLGFPF